MNRFRNGKKLVAFLLSAALVFNLVPGFSIRTEAHAATISGAVTANFNSHNSEWASSMDVGTNISDGGFHFQYDNRNSTNIWGASGSGTGVDGSAAINLGGANVEGVHTPETLTIQNVDSNVFGFASFYLNEAGYGHGTWIVEGFLHNASTGTQTIDTGTDTLPIGGSTLGTVTLNANFSNVDKVMISSSGTGFNTVYLDDFVFAPVVTTVTAVNPAKGSGAGGTSVTITGTNFAGATAVNFGAVAATSFTVNSNTSITAISPAGSGTVDITVTGPGGDSATGTSDQYKYLNLPNLPTTTVDAVVLSDDKGPDNRDFITNVAAQTITGVLSTNLAAGEKVEVSYDDGATWSDAASYTAGSPTWSTTATLSGSNTLKARVANTGGGGPEYSKAYTIDTTAPTVSSVAVPFAKEYGTGKDLTFTVNFSEPVKVRTGGGVPSIKLDIGGATKDAPYYYSSDPSKPMFRYIVASGDMDSDGITVDSLSLNGGTICDTAGNDANLTLNSVGSTSNVKVDTTVPAAPTIRVVASDDTGISSSDSITKNNSPTFTGTAKPGGSVIISIDDDANGAGSCSVQGDGTFNFQMLGISLPDGVHTVKAQCEDSAGKYK